MKQESSNRTNTISQEEALCLAIQRYDRATVLNLLKHQGLNNLPESEQLLMIQQIVALRDMRHIDVLVKQNGKLPVEMLDLDLDNRLNCDFVNQILNKYYAKFDIEEIEKSEQLFRICCKTGNKKACMVLLKKLSEKKYYIQLASAAYGAFELLLQKKATEFDGQTIVEILYAASLQKDATIRLEELCYAGYHITAKDLQGNTVIDLLENRIQCNAYPNNKKGKIMQRGDKNTLQYSKHLLEEMQAEHKKPRILTFCLVCGIAVLVVAIALTLNYGNKNDATAGSATAESTATESSAAESSSTGDTTTDTAASDNSSMATYATDTSLTVADGDTVNIDYTGYIDGVAFEGGSTDGVGADLTIGSNSYIDDFEQQLIGHNVGDSVEVKATFPDDYGKDELNGKEATFEVVINGIYQ